MCEHPLEPQAQSLKWVTVPGWANPYRTVMGVMMRTAQEGFAKRDAQAGTCRSSKECAAKGLPWCSSG